MNRGVALFFCVLEALCAAAFALAALYIPMPGWAQLLVWLAVAFFASATLAFLFRLRRHRPIATFRRPDGSYRIPIGKAGTVVLIPALVIVLIAMPVAVPLLAVTGLAALGISVGKLLAGDMVNPLEIKDALEILGMVLGSVAFFLVVVRSLMRTLRSLRRKAYLHIDRNGLEAVTSRPWKVSWRQVRAVDLKRFGGSQIVLLRGGPDLDALMDWIADGTPKRLLPEEKGLLVTSDQMPVSAADLYRAIVEHWSARPA